MPAGADTLEIGPSDVVNHMRVEDGLYVLGCFERRVTLLSQQVRALNLVHSLRALGLLDSGAEIAIVGGGVAGLTAAAGAARLGCKVTLLEQGEAPLHLIRGNHTRWLHPHLYDWPRDGAEREEAGLPLLDWQASLADDVVQQIQAGWDTLPKRDRIQVHTGAEVTDLGSGSPRRLTWNATSGFGTEKFALVILAVGFGLERPVAGIPRLLYWDNDSLHQASRSGTTRTLISGTGDGGLIDVLRVRLRDFRHPEVLTTFLGSPALGPVKKRLLAIEREAVTLESKRAGSSREHLYEEYMKVEVPAEVDEALRARLRTDGTTVVLNGRESLPLTLGASILNRFLVSRLIRHCGLAYRSGEFGEPKKGRCIRGAVRHRSAGVVRRDHRPARSGAGARERVSRNLEAARRNDARPQPARSDALADLRRHFRPRADRGIPSAGRTEEAREPPGSSACPRAWAPASRAECSS